MPVHDEWPVIVGGREERLPDPEQILLRLKRQRNAGPDTGMDEQAMPVRVHQRKLPKPCQVLSRQIAGVIDPVTLEGPLAPISPPVHQIAIRTISARSSDQHLFMIAAQADETTLLIRLSPHQELHNPTTVGSPVDVIADEDKPGVLFRTSKVAHGKEREQLVEAPVNIADGECQ